MEGIARRHGRIALAAGSVALAVIVSMANAVFLLDVLRSSDAGFAASLTTEHVAAKAAFSAALCWAATIPAFVILRWVARHAGVGASSLVVVAGMAAVLVGLNGGRIQIAVFLPFSLQDGIDWDGLVLTPLVEEGIKLVAMGVVMVAAGARTARAGIVLGLAAGLGVTAFETAHWIVGYYLRDQPFWFGDVIAIRFALLGLGMHATVSAIACLGLGAWLGGGRRRTDLWMPVVGVLAATAVHAAWNATANGLYISLLPGLTPAGHVAGTTQRFVAASMAGLILLAVPWVLLVVAWRRNEPRPEPGPEPEPDPTLPAPPPAPA